MPIPPSAVSAEGIATLAAADTSPFAASVARGLSLPQKQLDPRFFYDDLGSALFDAITRIPEYTITRAELALLQRCGSDLLAALPHVTELVELGPGNGEKLENLLRHRTRELKVRLIDISPAALESASTRLRRSTRVDVSTHAGTFIEQLQALPPSRGCRAVLLLGSNLGNFTPAESAAFLRDVRQCLVPGDALVLGLDLVKPERTLIAAYDDPLGVTAAFNKNALARINRELDGDFDLLAFDHRAVWNPSASRIEMHLVSILEQTAAIGALSMQVRFQIGETIWTESSHKYTEAGVRPLVESAGFRLARTWLDREHGFMEALCLA